MHYHPLKNLARQALSKKSSAVPHYHLLAQRNLDGLYEV